jgi:hypothetical protein
MEDGGGEPRIFIYIIRFRIPDVNLPYTVKKVSDSPVPSRPNQTLIKYFLSEGEFG